MQKYSIKIALIYCAVFTALAVLLHISFILQIDPGLVATIANVAWLVIALKTSKVIKGETAKTKLCIYGAVFAPQLISNRLIVVMPLLSDANNLLLGIFSGMAMGITVLIMTFLLARSINSEKFYMWILKGCLYIIFALGIIIFIGVFSLANIDVHFLLQEQ